MPRNKSEQVPTQVHEYHQAVVDVCNHITNAGFDPHSRLGAQGIWSSDIEGLPLLLQKAQRIRLDIQNGEFGDKIGSANSWGSLLYKINAFMLNPHG